MLRFTILSLFALGVASLGSITRAEDAHHEHMMKCAKTCSDCATHCDMCFKHCLTLVAEGKKDHATSMQLCADCAECCRSCATLCARHSPLSKHMLECCAKCCDECAASCEKMPDDKHMAQCAKMCRDCAKECREMLKHMTK